MEMQSQTVQKQTRQPERRLHSTALSLPATDRFLEADIQERAYSLKKVLPEALLALELAREAASDIKKADIGAYLEAVSHKLASDMLEQSGMYNAFEREQERALPLYSMETPPNLCSLLGYYTPGFSKFFKTETLTVLEGGELRAGLVRASRFKIKDPLKRSLELLKIAAGARIRVLQLMPFAPPKNEVAYATRDAIRHVELMGYGLKGDGHLASLSLVEQSVYILRRVTEEDNSANEQIR